jgi:hypothetical protein
MYSLLVCLEKRNHGSFFLRNMNMGGTQFPVEFIATRTVTSVSSALYIVRFEFIFIMNQ